MASVAVLMCMAGTADQKLALRALRSTAAGLRKDDAIFLLIDGSSSVNDDTFRVAAATVPLYLRRSPTRRGLASGLNQLIDDVLSSSRWEYVARMDADDECLPSRFEMQRRYLKEHPDVDVLGSLCHEVDESGTHLRTKKLPPGNREIIDQLPRRNPLNHPTVMMRRKVFESGMRYRTNVGLVEDWYLWIDLAALGHTFANMDEVVLKFLRGGNFFSKRGGWEQALAEWRVRCYARCALGQSSFANACYAVAASALRIMPAKVQAIAYRMAT